MVTVAKVSYGLFSSDFQAFADQLGRSLEETGFAVLTDVGIHYSLREKLLSALRQLFTFPDTVLRRCLAPPHGMAGQRGYFGFGDECHPDAKDREQKAYFQYGADQNIWPEDQFPEEWIGESLKDLAQNYFRILTSRLLDCLGAIEHYVGMNPDQLIGCCDLSFKQSWTIGRFLHYPPYTPLQLSKGVMRSQLHRDSNLITGLNYQPGLVVKTKSDEVLQIDGSNDDLVINSGMMLCLLLGNFLDNKTRFVPTQHGVQAPTAHLNSDRYTFPVFLHPRWETALPSDDELNPQGLNAKDWLVWWVNRCQVGDAMV